MRIKIIPFEKKTKINKNIILVCTSDIARNERKRESHVLFSPLVRGKKNYCFANENVKGLVTRINNSILWRGIRFMCSFRSTARFAILWLMYALRFRCFYALCMLLSRSAPFQLTHTLNNTHNDAVNRHRTMDRHSHCPTENPTRLFQNKLFILTAGKNIFEIVIFSLLSVYRFCCVFVILWYFCCLADSRVRSLASCVCVCVLEKKIN